MLKKTNWKAVLIAFTWLISISAVITLMGFIEVKKGENTCNKVEIILSGNQFFIEKSEVDQLLSDNNGLLVGRRLANINIQKLEDKLVANPFIEYAKVYLDMNGVIHADIKQREPILRVLTYAGQDFYIDKNGLKIPLSDHFTARVLVANGAILESFNNEIDTLKTKVAKDLFATAKFIAQNELWSEQIVQIYVNDDKDMELVPRVGSQKIVFGNGDDLESKFKNLLVFYKKAIPLVGWDTYSTINLKFKGQIVCVKRDSILQVKKQGPVLVLADSTTINKEVQDSIKI
jgi:cell division protein FtsQ